MIYLLHLNDCSKKDIKDFLNYLDFLGYKTESFEYFINKNESIVLYETIMYLDTYCFIHNDQKFDKIFNSITDFKKFIFKRNLSKKSKYKLQNEEIK